MKICQLCAVDFTLEKFLLPLIDTMQERGDDVTCVCSHGEYIDSLKDRGYKIKCIEISRSMQPLKHFVSIYQLFKFFREQRFDIVHVHTPVASLVGRIAAYFAKVPVIIYTAHGFYFHDNMPTIVKQFHIFLERITGLFTDVLFTQSLEDADTAKQYKFLPSDRIFAIGNGVDTKKFNPSITNKNCVSMRKSLSLPANAYVIGMVGRLVKEKGIVEFIEAAQRVLANNKNIYFVLVGDRLPSDHAASIDTSVLTINDKSKSHILFTGLRNDIPELLSAFDLFCLPSWREGMPRTIIEAMMMEKPVLATNIRGSREEVVHNQTGILVPPKSAKKLAEAMLKLSSNKAWSKKLGKQGRIRALSLYDEEKVVELQLKLISKIFSDR